MVPHRVSASWALYVTHHIGGAAAGRRHYPRDTYRNPNFGRLQIGRKQRRTQNAMYQTPVCENELACRRDKYNWRGPWQHNTLPCHGCMWCDAHTLIMRWLTLRSRWARVLLTCSSQQLTSGFIDRVSFISVSARVAPRSARVARLTSRQAWRVELEPCSRPHGAHASA